MVEAEAYMQENQVMIEKILKVNVSGKKVKVPICLKRIVLHNPSTQSYCVMVWDGQALKLVSWNNAGDDYGNDEWSLK